MLYKRRLVGIPKRQLINKWQLAIGESTSRRHAYFVCIRWPYPTDRYRRSERLLSVSSFARIKAAVTRDHEFVFDQTRNSLFLGSVDGLRFHYQRRRWLEAVAPASSLVGVCVGELRPDGESDVRLSNARVDRFFALRRRHLLGGIRDVVVWSRGMLCSQLRQSTHRSASVRNQFGSLGHLHNRR